MLGSKGPGEEMLRLRWLKNDTVIYFTGTHPLPITTLLCYFQTASIESTHVLNMLLPQSTLDLLLGPVETCGLVGFQLF